MNKETTSIVAFMYDKIDTGIIMHHIEQSLSKSKKHLHYTVVAVGNTAKKLLDGVYKPIIESHKSNIYRFDMALFQFSKTPASKHFTDANRTASLRKKEIGNIATHYSRKDLVITGCESDIQLDIAKEFAGRKYPVPVIGVFNGDKSTSRLFERQDPTFKQLWVGEIAMAKNLQKKIKTNVCSSVVCVKKFGKQLFAKKEDFRSSALRKSAEKTGEPYFKRKALLSSSELMCEVLAVKTK